MGRVWKIKLVETPGSPVERPPVQIVCFTGVKIELQCCCYITTVYKLLSDRERKRQYPQENGRLESSQVQILLRNCSMVDNRERSIL